MICTLLSTNPPHAGNLVDGIKTIEWRKKPLPLGKTYIYETRTGGGCAMVIGEVEVVGHEQVQAHRIRDWAVKAGCTDRYYLQAYAKGKDLYANFVVNAKRYEEPIPLSEFEHACPFHEKCFCCKYHFAGGMYEPPSCDYEFTEITRPPQSWCYVEEVKKCIA